MKKILLSSVFALFIIQSYSLTILYNRFDGSALCENLSMKLTLPDSLKGQYDIDVRVSKSDTGAHLFVDYFLYENDSRAIISEITTDLNPYFDISEFGVEIETWWNVVEKIYINQNLVSTNTTSGLPYQSCIETESKCNEITILRKTVHPICPSYKLFTSSSYTVSGDSISFQFQDSTVSLSAICLALGNKIITDTIHIVGLEALNYQLYELKRTFIDIVCITVPCPNYITYPVYIGKVDLSECLIPYPLNKISGSALCDNLTYTAYIANTLEVDDVRVVKNETSRQIHIHHYVRPRSGSDTAGYTPVLTNLSPYFPIDFVSRNEVWQLLSYTHLPGSESEPSYLQQFMPYQTCYQVASECVEARILRKSLREICPSVQTFTKTSKEIKNDIILVNFLDSLVDLPATCLAVGNYIHTDSIIVNKEDGLKALNYRVYLGNKMECIDGACPTIYIYQPLIGHADFSDCIINGFDDKNINTTYIYPNPVSAFITLQGVQGNIVLTNQYGQQVVLEGTGVFDVSALNAGMYIATFELNGEVKQEKVIIK